MASSRRKPAGRRAAALLLVLLAAPPALAAQAARGGPLTLAGRVQRVGAADTVGTAGVWVVLHRISARAQGPVDSVRTDAAGRFRFRVAAPESAAVYAASSQYAGIGYFGPPVSADAGAAAPPTMLLVYDTATAGPPLAVAMRHVVIARAGADGTRRVLDITEVRNDGRLVRVGADSLSAVWSQSLSPDVLDARIGESDVPASAVTFAEGRMLVAAPFPPGSKQIASSYLLPRGAGRLRIPVDQPTGRLEILVEDSASSVRGLAAAEPIELDGRAFRRFGADSVAAGRVVTLEFGGGGGPLGGRGLLVGALALASLGLVAGMALAVRRRAVAVEGPATAAADGSAVEGRDALLARIVALDERYAGREAGTSPEDWAAYQQRRGELKRRLEALLPGR